MDTCPDIDSNLSVVLDLAFGVLRELLRKPNRIAANPHDNCVFAKVNFVSSPVSERPQICLITDAIRLDFPTRRDLPVTHGVERYLRVIA
jgi:hypothetical protein